MESGVILSKSLGDMMTLATPVTVPGLTAKPLSRLVCSVSFALKVASSFSLVTGMVEGWFIRNRCARRILCSLARVASSGTARSFARAAMAAVSSASVR